VVTGSRAQNVPFFQQHHSKLSEQGRRMPLSAVKGTASSFAQSISNSFPRMERTSIHTLHIISFSLRCFGFACYGLTKTSLTTSLTYAAGFDIPTHSPTQQVRLDRHRAACRNWLYHLRCQAGIASCSPRSRQCEEPSTPARDHPRLFPDCHAVQRAASFSYDFPSQWYDWCDRLRLSHAAGVLTAGQSHYPSSTTMV
jgi:hypothetical protein